MTNIVLLGDPRVGKTSWVSRIHKRQIDEDSYLTTMGKSMTRITFNNRDIIFHDIGGYERYHNILSLNYYIANGALIFYDVTNNHSEKRVAYWISKLPKGIPYVVVGNKIDLSKDYVQTIDKVSCLRNYDVSQPLVDLLEQIPEDISNATPTFLKQLLDYFYSYLVDWLPMDK
jgi:small GTP-binding protein